jgi:hypothetical protein
MKKIFSALFLGLLFAGLAIAGEQDFTIVNKTGVKIAKLYISPSSLEKWGKDVLPVASLAVGNECDVLVSRSEEAEFWDLMVMGPDGTSIKWPGLRLNDFSKITLAIEKGQPVAYYE